jgi:hypothetical protein
VFDLRQTSSDDPLTPEGKAIFDQRQATLSKDDPECALPADRTAGAGAARTAIQDCSRARHDRDSLRIGNALPAGATDGRPLPGEIDWPAWQGFSIGRWEGETS